MNRKDRRAAGKRRESFGASGSAASDTEGLFALARRHHQAGQLSEAEGLYRRIVELDRKHVGGIHHLGIIALQRGQPQAAIEAIGRAIAVNDRIPECHYGIACAFQALGRLNEAIAHYQRALALKPNYAEAYGNLGTALAEQGSSDQAESHYRRALQLNPRSIEGYVNLGCLLMSQRKWDAAAAQFEHALALNANLAEAHANLGDVYFAQGRLDDAVQRYDRALALKPTLTDVHNKLGIVFATQGDFAEACRRFQIALTHNPGLVEAYANLARTLLSAERAGEAMAIILQGMTIAETPSLKTLFIQCLRFQPGLPNAQDCRALMLRMLSEPWARPDDLAPVVANVLKQESALSLCISRAVDAWPRRLPAQELFGGDGLAAASQNRLLLCLLETATIADIEFERFLTNARYALLQIASATEASATADQNILRFCCALARHCFINEYVFALADEELAAAGLLRDKVISALGSGSAVSELWLAAAAAYSPLHSWPVARSILERSWSEALDGILTQQIREPAEEQELRASMPVLTPIENDVSRLVQQQYEENPYPRWGNADRRKPLLRIDQYLRSMFPDATFQSLNKSEIDILVAGCGTGQHAIESASRISGARVLGIDLSRSSLAYAKRKTRELELHNVEYGQADILKLDSIGRTFDIIESSGVLHHLGDPLAGWRLLLSLLGPGGFMHVGLYSEAARVDIVKARALIAERGYGSTAEDIRRARQELVADDCKDFLSLRSIGDFFSMSGCRDLLFHVHERRLTIPKIASFLSANRLNLLGFELDATILEHYRARFPTDKAMTDLASWETFELDNPRTFTAMYNFWVQKKS